MLMVKIMDYVVDMDLVQMDGSVQKQILHLTGE